MLGIPGLGPELPNAGQRGSSPYFFNILKIKNVALLLLSPKFRFLEFSEELVGHHEVYLLIPAGYVNL
jgi:hypothetical protein